MKQNANLKNLLNATFTLLILAMAVSCSTPKAKPRDPVVILAVGSDYPKPGLIFVKPGELINGVPAHTNFWCIAVPDLLRLQMADLIVGKPKIED